MPILPNISSPADLVALSDREIGLLCDELRQEITNVVSKNGGHLAPNLGAVELTVAVERVFGADGTPIIWDVGHQAYAHKILTGRRDDFKNLRQTGGPSGFLSPAESSSDIFYSGHAGVALSQAEGLAEAARLQNSPKDIVAIIGDGSFANGITLEALNNLRTMHQDARLIVIINDNGMAISNSVGNFSRYLNRIITSAGYNRAKTVSKSILNYLPGGKFLIRSFYRLKLSIKSLFVSASFFESIGFKYVGPQDGHDGAALTKALERIKKMPQRPIAVHVITTKGKGCYFAENDPEIFHGCGPFDPNTGLASAKGGSIAFTDAFSLAIVDAAAKNENIVAITAAMAEGTGLSAFRQAFPRRFYDVGIAEEHAFAFASGLAKGGLRPVVAIYATFLQRAVDGVFHDVCLQNLPIVICVDRAGAVGDGPSHHGILDIGFLRGLKNLAILMPRDAEELAIMLQASIDRNAPVVLRYPKGKADNLECPRSALEWGKAECVANNGNDVAIWAMGGEVKTALKVADMLKQRQIGAVVVNARFLAPFDGEMLLATAANTKCLVTIEDNDIAGGLASIVDGTIVNAPHGHVLHFGWNEMPAHGSVADMKKAAGLTAENIAQRILDSLK